MSDRDSRSPGTGEPPIKRGRLRPAVAATLIAVAIVTGVLAIASATFAKASNSARAAAVQCRINFQASSLHLGVGKDLVLTWTAVGADKLTASWTTGYVPFVGAVTTTMNRPGTFSYQVTGTVNGQYCGSAEVHVAFAGAPITHPSSSHAAGAGSSTQASGAAAHQGGRPPHGVAGTEAVRNAHGRYPAQSPTGGSGIPWYREPIDLVVISMVAAVGSLALWWRERVRAAIVHAH
jgi:hypothetical protein